MPLLPKDLSAIASITINRNAWLSLPTKGRRSRPFLSGLCSVDEEVIILKQTQIPPERLLILNLLIFFKQPSHPCPWKMQGRGGVGLGGRGGGYSAGRVGLWRGPRLKSATSGSSAPSIHVPSQAGPCTVCMRLPELLIKR